MEKNFKNINQFKIDCESSLTQKYIPPKYVVKPAEHDKIYFYLEELFKKKLLNIKG